MGHLFILLSKTVHTYCVDCILLIHVRMPFCIISVIFSILYDCCIYSTVVLKFMLLIFFCGHQLFRICVLTYFD